MAKISTYVIDGTIVDGDKVIGSDANNDMITKNYTIGDLVAYFAVSIGNNYFVPYVNANNDVDLGSFSLLANNLTLTNTITVDGSAGLPGQVIISQGSGAPAVWGYGPQTQDLSNVLNIGNTATKSIILDNANSLIELDVEGAHGTANVYIIDKTAPNTAQLSTTFLSLEDSSISTDAVYLSNKIRYNDSVGFVDVLFPYKTNQAFVFPSVGGFVPVSVNGNFADSSGNILLPTSTDVTSVTATAPLSSSGGQTPDISISQAGLLSDGYLSSTDWNSFNSRVPYIGATSNVTLGNHSITADNGIYNSEVAPDFLSVSNSSFLNYGALYFDRLEIVDTAIPSTMQVKATGLIFPDGSIQTTAASAGLSGSGTADYLSKWTNASTLGDSSIYEDASVVRIGKNTIAGYGIINSVFSLYSGTNSAIEIGITSGNRYINSTVNGIFLQVGGVNKGSFDGTQFYYTDKIAVSNNTTSRVELLKSNTLAISGQQGGEINFVPQVNNLSGSHIIRVADYSYGNTAGVKGNLYLYGGRNTFDNVYGDVLIQHDGTSSRGNVGVGTNTPAHKLDVIGTFHTTGINTLDNLGGTGTRMVVADASGVLSTQSIPTVSGGLLKGTAAGTDTYTTTIAGVSGYADGDAYLIRFTNGNTTGATLNINGLGAIQLYRNNDGPVIGGDIFSGSEMICVYNSTITAFQVIGTSPNSLISYVTNDDSVTLTKGMAVYAFSGTGDRMTVKRAFNTSDSTSAQTVGLVLSASIGVNQKGFIMMQGLLDGLNILPTATWNDGDPVYLGATAGSITNTKPYAPNHLVYLGIVTTASNGSAGRMYVRVQNGYELDELHNVQAQSPTFKDTLWYDNTVSPAQWKTASISTILGYTPFQLPLLTSGSVLFSDGTTIAQNNSNFFWDNTNNRLGIGVTSPISKLNIQTNSIGVSQTDAMGVALVNTTAATNVLNQNSPGIVFQGSAWKTAATASSRQSNWRVISTPATDSSEIEGRLTFENAVAGGAYAAGAPYFYRDRFGNYGINTANAVINALSGLSALSIVKLNPGNPSSHLAVSGNFGTGPGIAISNSVGFVPTSGSQTFHGYEYSGTINQTGGANGITRGIYLNPTLTSAADFRAIESTNGRVVLTDTYSAGSGSLSGGLLSLSQTWNTTGNVTAVAINITNTASGTNSRIFDVVVNGSREFAIDRQGTIGVSGQSRYQGFSFVSSGGTSSNATYISCTGSNSSANAGTIVNAYRSTMSFTPNAQNAQFNNFFANPTINQTGTASGISRGFFVDPILTNAVDFRGIEVTNGSIVLPYTGQSATYAIKTSDYLVNCTSGTFTATLPTAVGCTGKIYIIKNSGAGAVTVATTSSQTIDGATTYSLGTQYKYVQVVSNGANWIITGNN